MFGPTVGMPRGEMNSTENEDGAFDSPLSHEYEKAAADVCTFSTLVVGCYSSVLIDPTGDERE